MDYFNTYGNSRIPQQFDFDTVKLTSLGFSDEEINTLQYI